MDAHADVPPSGAVLGIDVGYSRKAATTGLCLLLWDVRSVELSFLRTNSTTPERRRDVRALVAGAPLHAVAIDGPLTRGLRRVSRYRAAEALLSRGVLQKRGKPGQTSSPVGQQLHFHATELAELVLAEVTIDLACHYQPIHEQCVVEAFPNMFLAAGVAEVDLPLLHRDASDRYWAVLVAQSTRLSQLFTALLPGRAVKYDLCGCVDHDDRAALVCALSALSVVAKSHVGVGDACDGDIVLPPRSWWGPSLTGDSPWMERVLRENLAVVRRNKGRHQNHGDARFVLHSGEWQR